MIDILDLSKLDDTNENVKVDIFASGIITEICPFAKPYPFITITNSWNQNKINCYFKEIPDNFFRFIDYQISFKGIYIYKNKSGFAPTEYSLDYVTFKSIKNLNIHPIFDDCEMNDELYF